MSRQLFLEMFSKWLILDFILLLLSFGFTWYVFIILGFKILKAEVKLKGILLGAIIGALISIFIRPFFSGIFTFFIIVPLILFLKFCGKAKWIIACWVTFLIFCLSSIGSLLVINPLLNNQAAASFFFKTRYGVMLGSLSEMLIPGVLLIFLKIYHIPFIPSPGKLLKSTDFVDIYVFGALLFWCYDSLMNVWKFLLNNPEQFMLKPLVIWGVSTGAVIAFYLLKVNNQKKLELAASKIQELTDNQQKHNDFSKIPPPDLDPREKLIVRCIIEGMTNKEIAAKVQMSRGGIGNAITPIYKKLGVESRVQLITYFVKNNLMEWLAND